MSESPAGNQQAGPSVASSPPCLLEDFSLPRLAYPFFPKEAAAPHNLDPNRRLKWMRYRPWIRFPTIPTQIVLLSPFSPCLYGASRARPMATLSGGGRHLLLRRVPVPSQCFFLPNDKRVPLVVLFLSLTNGSHLPEEKIGALI
jgi:hypothetical protein